jgi:hypothetical protein
VIVTYVVMALFDKFVTEFSKAKKSYPFPKVIEAFAVNALILQLGEHIIKLR